MGDPDGEALSAILDSVTLAITSLAPDGTIRFVNALAARNLGEPREAIIGRSIFEYFPERAAATRERLRQTITQRAVQRFEAQLVLPTGEEKAFESAYCPAFGADGEILTVQIVAQDVTELRRRELAAHGGLWGVVTDDLSMSRRRFEALLESAPILVSVHDLDMTIRYISRGVAEWSVDEIIGTSPRAWVVEASQATLRDAFDRAVAERTVAECEVEDVIGRSWLVRYAPLVYEDRVTQVLGCVLDVTERHRLQAQLDQKRALASLGTMAGGIAHDFNNLLTVIMGNVTLARLRPDRTSLLDEIEAATTRAAELCKQMLAYAGRDRGERAPGHLDRVIRETARLTRAAVSAKIRIEHDLAETLPATRCPSVLLGQVVLNLVQNAADAIGDEHGAIQIHTRVDEGPSEAEELLPEPLPPGRYVVLEVGDDGAGMDAETRRRIFDPFYTTKPTGHGLGLSVVMGIVSSQGAAIAVRSTPGEGTTVVVLFPIHEGPCEAAEAPAEEARSSSTGGTVLVVDDEEGIRKMASAVLEAAGFSVLQAADGDAALTELAKHAKEVRAIVLDVTMPRRDGRRTLEAIRETHAELPVVLSSGRSIDGVADPHVHILAKPYSPPALVDALERALGRT